MTPGQPSDSPLAASAHPAPPAEPPQAGYGALRAPAEAIPAKPDPAETGTAPAGHPTPAPSEAVELAARAAHRSQFANPTVEHMAWTGATPAYRQRWHHIAQAALDAAATHLNTLAAQRRQQPGHNGDQTAGIDQAAHHLRHEPGS